jgi:hypothetical protein
MEEAQIIADHVSLQMARVRVQNHAAATDSSNLSVRISVA